MTGIELSKPNIFKPLKDEPELADFLFEREPRWLDAYNLLDAPARELTRKQLIRRINASLSFSTPAPELDEAIGQILKIQRSKKGLDRIEITESELKEALRHDQTWDGVSKILGMSPATLRNRMNENPALRKIWDARTLTATEIINLACDTCGKPRSIGSASQCRDCYTNGKPETLVITKVGEVKDEVLSTPEPEYNNIVIPEKKEMNQNTETEVWSKGGADDPLGLYKDITVRVSQRQVRCLTTIAEWTDRDIQDIYSEAFDNLIDFEFENKGGEAWSEQLEAVRQVIAQSKSPNWNSISIEHNQLLKHLLIWLRDAQPQATVGDLRTAFGNWLLKAAATQLEEK